MKVVMLIASVSRSTRGLVAAWLIVEVTIWASAWAIGRAGLSFPQSPVDVLSTRDGTHYSAIARNGYLTEGAEVRRFQFFPLLPAISRLLGGARARPGTLIAQPGVKELLKANFVRLVISDFDRAIEIVFPGRYWEILDIVTPSPTAVSFPMVPI